MEFSTVVLLDNSIFLSFFESNNNNKAAAAYSLASAYQVMTCTLATTASLSLSLSIHLTKVLHVMQAFTTAQATGQGDMQSVLQATFTSLDEGFLADTQYSSMVRCAKHWQYMQHPLTSSQLPRLLQDRAASAASGVIVYLDFKAEKLWGGQVGQSRQLIIGQLFHGLAAQRTDALVLDTPSGYGTC